MLLKNNIRDTEVHTQDNYQAKEITKLFISFVKKKKKRF